MIEKPHPSEVVRTGTELDRASVTAPYRLVEPLWREMVGCALRSARQTAGLRLVDVAQCAGVSPQYLSEIERGLKDPSSEMLAAVAGALQLRVVDLVGRSTHHTVSCPGPVANAEAVCLVA